MRRGAIYMSLTVLKYFLSGLDTNHPYVWLVIVL